MTKMLASVSNLEEARHILAGGIDIIDIKDPDKGVLGAVATDVVRKIVNLVNGRMLTSATIGDIPLDVPGIAGGIAAMHATGIDIIKVGIFARALPGDVREVIRQNTRAGVRIVLVFFADLQPLDIDFRTLAATGIHGVMLDTANKTGGSLRTIMNDQTLAGFIREARGAGLLTGLAGSLRQNDITPLLALNPDYLGFRSALCNGQQRNRSIDCNAVRSVRALIPMHRYDESKVPNLMASVY
ncbi:MAG: (5-formylfuran-3-yl)methyl phosphate synthase [Gammaproteobacteria bacterium]